MIDLGQYDALKTEPSSKEEQNKVFARFRARLINFDISRDFDTEFEAVCWATSTSFQYDIKKVTK